MRILMVTSSYPKFPGDTTAPFIEAIAHGVATRGHAVDVVLPQHPDLRRSADEPVRFLPYRYAPGRALQLWGYAQSLKSDVRVRPLVYALAPLVALSLRRCVTRLLRSQAYDLVHAHWLVPNAAMVADVVRRHRRPLVVSLHGSDVFMAERFAPARWLARRALVDAGAVTACSGDLRERVLRLGASPERTRTIPYGVDVEAFRPDQDLADVRAALGVPAAATFVLALGRLVEKKGFRHLIAALSGMPSVRLVIAGQGDLRGSLAALAEQQGVPLSLPGNLDRGTMARALAAADIVAVPSVVDSAGNVDGLPNTLLEALASGRPIVASAVAGIPEVLRHEQEGLLVPPGDVAALREALHRLQRDPELRSRLGASARRRACERLTWPMAAKSFEEAYVQATTLDAR